MCQSNPISEKFLELVEIMSRLRADDGCPWDKEQTHVSLKKYLIEEAYEFLDSIDAADDKAMVEECGDVLLQVIFHARIAEEEERFSIEQVLDVLCEKLVHRHPHVFGDRETHSAEEVLRNWEEDKQKEKPERESILEGIPKSLPSLMQAHQIQDRASRVGFDWEMIEEVFDKFEEEWEEFREAYTGQHRLKIEEELGDMLFAIVNVARYVDVDPEQALNKANEKFKRRFLHIEKEIAKTDKTLKEASLEEMDKLWDDAKALENKELRIK